MRWNSVISHIQLRQEHLFCSRSLHRTLQVQSQLLTHIVRDLGILDMGCWAQNLLLRTKPWSTFL
jgi:hypothetical protein